MTSHILGWASAVVIAAMNAGIVPVATFKLNVTEPSSKLKTIEMKPDGTVLYNDKATAKLVKDSLVDASGKPVLTVAADGTVKVAGDEKGFFRLKFVGDELLLADKGKISVGDDGTLHSQTGANDRVVGKVEAPPKSKRAVELSYIAMSVHADIVGPPLPK